MKAVGDQSPTCIRRLTVIATLRTANQHRPVSDVFSMDGMGSAGVTPASDKVSQELRLWTPGDTTTVARIGRLKPEGLTDPLISRSASSRCTSSAASASVFARRAAAGRSPLDAAANSRRRMCGRAIPPELASRSCDYRKRARRVSRLKRASAPEKKMPNSVIARTWRRQEARSPQRSLMWDAKTLDHIGITPARAARCVWLRRRRDAHAAHWGQLHCVRPGRASPDRRLRLRQRPEPHSRGGRLQGP